MKPLKLDDLKPVQPYELGTLLLGWSTPTRTLRLAEFVHCAGCGWAVGRLVSVRDQHVAGSLFIRLHADGDATSLCDSSVELDAPEALAPVWLCHNCRGRADELAERLEICAYLYLIGRLAPVVNGSGQNWRGQFISKTEARRLRLTTMWCPEHGGSTVPLALEMYRKKLLQRKRI